MRYVVVRRLTVLLGIAFLLCAMAFAWIVRDEPTARGAEQPLETGGALFARHCAGCHAADDVRRQLREGGADRRRSMEVFLRDHGDATDAEDRRILDYLTVPGGQ